MSYPNDIKSLTGLRFIAAFMLLIYFFWNRLLTTFPQEIGLITHSRLGVDLFFILSGFVLAHVYGPQIENKKYCHRSFIWARLSRIYPLHLVTLLIMIALYIVALEIGADLETKAFDPSQLPFHLLLLNAWGFLKSDGWNFPSWSISAEWFAYLTFPISFYLATKFKNRPIIGVGLITIITTIIYFYFQSKNIDLLDMSWQGAQFRIICSFIGGIMLWQIGNKYNIGAKNAKIGIGMSVLYILITTTFLELSIFTWPALLAIVYFVAETSKYEKPVLSSKTWVYLGEISFAMYMIHLPVDIALYQIIEKIFGELVGLKAIIGVIVGLILSFIAAVIFHEIIEKPCRNYMRKNIPGFLSNKPKNEQKVAE